MALNASKVKQESSGPRAPVLDEGAYPARLVGVIDLGLQPQSYNGEAKAPKNQLQIIYESSDEFMPGEDGEPNEEKPRWFWEDFPLNHIKSDKATSTKRYMALDPQLEFDGDWSKLIGRPVIVGLTRTKGRDGNEYNNVGSTSTMRAKEAAKLPELVNDPILFDLEEPDLEVFNSLPNRLQEKIKSNLEYEGSALEALIKGGKAKTTKGEPRNPAPDAKSGAEKTASHSEEEEDSDDNNW